MNFEIIKPNLSIPVLSVSNQSELISLEKLLEEVGENAIPNSRNKGGQLAMPIIITQGMMCGKIIFQMDHSISDLASINVIKNKLEVFLIVTMVKLNKEKAIVITVKNKRSQ